MTLQLQNQEHRVNYRTDIDGLRSIAVLLVIFNHVGMAVFPGGYIGVDVFFVISGFLITSIIYPKMLDNQFRYTDFYSRRIKRLLPALLLVVVVSAIVFSLVMLPDDLSKFFTSIVWVLFYLGNIFFWREHGGYFRGDAQEAPLLHTWSLAVEEQYYVIWPVMIVIMLKIFGKRWLPLSAIILCTGLTYFSEWATQATISAAYYLLPTRFFELLVGSCLAVYWKNLPKGTTSLHHLLSISGFGLIFASATLLNEHSVFPGYNALYSAIGAVLLIYSSSGVVNRILSLTPFVFIGQISYSLYLWHWPILVLLRYLGIEKSSVIQLSVIAITFVLATLSWKYVEQPIRKARHLDWKSAFIKVYAIPCTLITALSVFVISQDGFPNRFSSDILRMEAAFNSHADKYRRGCHSTQRHSEYLPNPDCRFGAGTAVASVDVFLIGDSHANHFFPFIEEMLQDAGLSIQDYTLDQCAPVYDLAWGESQIKVERCKDRNDKGFKHIRNSEFTYVVLAAAWPGENTRIIHDASGGNVTDPKLIKQLVTDHLLRGIDVILGAGAIPVLIEDTPDLGGKSPKCPIKKELYGFIRDCRIVRPQNDFFSAIVRELQSRRPELITLRPRKLICKGTDCTMEKDGIPLYRDDHHLNVEAARLLGRSYMQAYGNPFRNSPRTTKEMDVASPPNGIHLSQKSVFSINI